ncbi:Protein TIC 55, chloroplastic [Coccomyxa sp. Obi]|nr:Protein TIC 55, chloroplastic [Coccomyxa sp. Obi]
MKLLGEIFIPPCADRHWDPPFNESVLAATLSGTLQPWTPRLTQKQTRPLAMPRLTGHGNGTPSPFVDDLDPGRPHAMELLGKRLVIWYDSQQQKWTAFEDRCPHRLAPLSEGRIEPSDGTLMCSYHGWRFRGDGACTKIPQALDSKAEQAACSSGRSCAAVYPTQVRQGFLHVWGNAGADAAEEAARRPPILIPQLDPDAAGAIMRDGTPTLDTGKRYMRDLPYSYDFLVENLIDPAHVNYAHNGVIGSRNTPTAGYYEISPTPLPDPTFEFPLEHPSDGISMEIVSKFMGRRTAYKIQFIAPAIVRYYFPKYFGETNDAQMWMTAVPTAPGRCRCLWWFFQPSTGSSKRLQKVAARPVWQDHMTRNLVFDGDNVFLHGADRLAAAAEKETGSRWKGSYFMPAQADRMVVEFRKWLDSRGGGGPTPGDPGPILDDRKALLDRWEQHTKNCPSCLKALAMFEKLRIAVVVAGAAAVLAGVAVLASGARLLSPAPPLLLAVVAAAVYFYRRFSQRVQAFYFLDYQHALR